MTVQELIDKLLEIENKSATIGVISYDDDGDTWGCDIISVSHRSSIYVKYNKNTDYYIE